MTELLCPWGPSSFIFYSNDPGVPQLLYYAYVPIMLITLFFSLYVFFKDGKSLRSSLLLAISIFFIGSTLNAIFEWVSNNPFAQMYSWQIRAFFELPISLLSIYFIYVFLENKESKILKHLLIFLFLPIIILLPTKFNIARFYLTDSDCGGSLGLLWYYIYTLEILSIFVLMFICLRRYFKIRKDRLLSAQTLILIFGSVIFIGLFNISDVFGDLTKIYQINLIGPIGLLLFICLLSYMIVRYKTFNIKLIGAQALVWALVVLIGSQFFYLNQASDISLIIITAFTLVISAILGLNLVRGVKKEIMLREKLEVANAGQTNLIHIMNHQIKGYLGTNKNIFAELLTDDYGSMPEATKPLLQKGLKESDAGVQYVTEILKGASAENGTLPYDMKPMDFKNLLSEVASKQKEIAEKKGLKFNFNVANGNYNIIGDVLQLSEAIRNLINNSISYTPSGSVSVNLSPTGNLIQLIVKDTGVGIKDEDKSKLFKAGGVGRDSIKVNVNSSGYGLVFAKGVIEAHKGKIWFESAGPGLGTTFFVDLPVR